MKSSAGSIAPPAAASPGSAARGAGELPAAELALDLELDDEEEQRHERVVDQVAHVVAHRSGPSLTSNAALHRAS